MTNTRATAAAHARGLTLQVATVADIMRCADVSATGTVFDQHRLAAVRLCAGYPAGCACMTRPQGGYLVCQRTSQKLAEAGTGSTCCGKHARQPTAGAGSMQSLLLLRHQKGPAVALCDMQLPADTCGPVSAQQAAVLSLQVPRATLCLAKTAVAPQRHWGQLLGRWPNCG